ncbi:MAG: glycine-rich protein [Clostridia bacterium]
MSKGEKLYIYVGGHPTTWTKGGYNGGGYSTKPYIDNNAAGGGATDIRIINRRLG